MRFSFGKFSLLLTTGFAALAIFASLQTNSNVVKSPESYTYETSSRHFDVHQNRPAISSIFPSALNASTGNKATTKTSIGSITNNWAGYISTGGTYTGITGSWTVPTITASDQATSADASWVGIGGATGDDLIQVGTQNVVSDGQVTTGTFYEELPGASETVPGVTVAAGDDITASIQQTSQGEWSISITDESNGETYSNTVAYTSSESSAEWIEEAPSIGNSVLPLDEFGSVAFTNGSTVENSNQVDIAGSNPQAVNIADNTGQTLTDISALNGSGTGFTVSRTTADTSGSTGGQGQATGQPGGWTRPGPGSGQSGNGWSSPGTGNRSGYSRTHRSRHHGWFSIW